VGAGRAVAVFMLSAGVALAVPFAAAAHLSADPAFLFAGGKQRLAVTVHNDRDAPMTGFRLVAPPELRILGTGGVAGWNEVLDGSTATWSGASVGPGEPVTFEVDLDAESAEPGTVELQGDQLYADGEAVPWPLTLTIVPPGGEVPSENDGLGTPAVVVLVLLGALVVALAAFVAWQRRRPVS
jgi:hypothetical protein